MRLICRDRAAIIEVTQPRSPVARMRGLIGSNELERGRGMLLRGRQVHTVGMRYAIDALYLGGDLSVIRIATLRPWRLGPFVWRARWVLELAGGEASRLGLDRGDLLEVSEESE